MPEPGEAAPNVTWSGPQKQQHGDLASRPHPLYSGQPCHLSVTQRPRTVFSVVTGHCSGFSTRTPGPHRTGLPGGFWASAGSVKTAQLTSHPWSPGGTKISNLSSVRCRAPGAEQVGKREAPAKGTRGCRSQTRRAWPGSPTWSVPPGKGQPPVLPAGDLVGGASWGCMTIDDHGVPWELNKQSHSHAQSRTVTHAVTRTVTNAYRCPCASELKSSPHLPGRGFCPAGDPCPRTVPSGPSAD